MSELDQDDGVVLNDYNFCGHIIQIFLLPQSNELCFISKDLGDALGLTNIRMSMEALDEDEKGSVSITYGPSTAGGAPNMAYVTLAGANRIIMASRKPEAKTFQRWVLHEVLPSIYQTGQYKMDLSKPENLARVALDLTQLVGSLQSKLSIAEPKAAAYDDFINSEGVYLPTTAGKMLGYQPNIFCKMLRDSRYLFYRQHKLIPYEEHLQNHLFVVKLTVRTKEDGTSHSYPQAYITPKGLEHFRALYGGLNILPFKQVG